jgi:hypothetical protein
LPSLKPTLGACPFKSIGISLQNGFQQLGDILLVLNGVVGAGKVVLQLTAKDRCLRGNAPFFCLQTILHVISRGLDETLDELRHQVVVLEAEQDLRLFGHPGVKKQRLIAHRLGQWRRQRHFG